MTIATTITTTALFYSLQVRLDPQISKKNKVWGLTVWDFYKLDAIPVIQTTMSKHRRDISYNMWYSNICRCVF